jgi:hypothetical protein
MVVLQPADDSGDRGGSADGPNSENAHHSGGRSSVQHTTGVLPGAAVDVGGHVGPWRSSWITGWPEVGFSPVIGHHSEALELSAEQFPWYIG